MVGFTDADFTDAVTGPGTKKAATVSNIDIPTSTRPPFSTVE